ncbi:activator protein [Alcanivorax hongdengensis A-11-3]|uniref:Activator protein n=1 Tax=Alcanivorax hongdengensis A-11-3 TaxID=1177179 RepID=L0WB33_9GAMM|nr:hypothetical protein [Alcanivorax hongdengensis]EKF73963.1 activator protein [Alcanivorax hongdengensis A-11-3]
MRTCSLPAAMLACGLLLTVSAGAAEVSVSPAGAFSASGDLAMKKGHIPVTCATTFDGTVAGDGAIEVTAVHFGGLNPLCKSIKALGLPWQGQVDSPHQLTVQDMQVKVRVPVLGGICGPGPVSLVWRNARASAAFEQVTLGPDCAMDGTMITSPSVDIRAVDTLSVAEQTR